MNIMFVLLLFQAIYCSLSNLLDSVKLHLEEVSENSQQFEVKTHEE